MSYLGKVLSNYSVYQLPLFLLYDSATNQIQGLSQYDDGNITFGTYSEGIYAEYGALIIGFQYVQYTNVVVGPSLYFILQNITDFSQHLFNLTLATGAVTSLPLNFQENIEALGGLIWEKNNNQFYAIGIASNNNPIDLVSLNPSTGDVTPLNLLTGYYNFVGAYTQDPSTNIYYVSITSNLLNNANLTAIQFNTKPQVISTIELQYAPIGAIALP